MLIFYTIPKLKEHLNIVRGRGKSIGFVPTMGALHRGHISLIERAKNENDFVVCSIFVNPTQFNDQSDLEKYPRMLEADKRMLLAAQCDVLFAPEVEEIYPKPDNTIFDFNPLDTVMEGKHRPGHFNGVAMIVRQLFNIVEPIRAYFGQKDFQQLAIIKQLVQQFHLAIEIVSCPIYREEDGLAMSSRNILLTAEERKHAPLISKTLFKAKELREHHSIKELKERAEKEINKDALMQLEYFEIVNAETLMSIENLSEAKAAVACVAVKIGKVRLIDNIILFP